MAKIEKAPPQPSPLGREHNQEKIFLKVLPNGKD